MDIKVKIRKLILVLAVIAGVICASFCVMSIADKYSGAHRKLDVCEEAAEGWEACRLMKPEFYKANSEAVRLSLENVHQAKQNFWIQISKTQLIGLYLIAGSLGASGGFIVAWILFLYCGIALHELFRWFNLTVFGRGERGAKRLNVQNPQ